MNIERQLPILGLIACFAMASCSGDEKSPTPNSQEMSSGSASTAPPTSVADASAATRQPAAQVAPPTGRAPTLDPPPAAAPDPVPMDPSSAIPEAAEADVPLLSPEEAAIPTQEEADLEANQSINDENADAELQKLETELGGEGGG